MADATLGPDPALEPAPQGVRASLQPHERLAFNLLWLFAALAAAGAGLVGYAAFGPLAGAGLGCLALAGALLLVAHLLVRE